jgi:hypothetical protein
MPENVIEYKITADASQAKAVAADFNRTLRSGTVETMVGTRLTPSIAPRRP